MEHFADNLARLLGMHRLDAKELSDFTGISESALSKWQSGQRNPSFKMAIQLADFFYIGVGPMAREPFADLLETELSSRERFEKVEADIQRSRARRDKKFRLVDREEAERRDLEGGSVGIATKKGKT